MYRYPPTHSNDGWLRLYRLCLRLYPPQFRKQYGGEMTLFFRDCLRDARQAGYQELMKLWLRLAMDIAVSAPRAHLEELKMTTAPSRTAQIGAVFAMVCAVLLVGNLLGIGRLDSAESPFGWFLPALLPVGWFIMLCALYRRVEVNYSAPFNKFGLAAGVIALSLMGVAVGVLVTRNGNVYDETAGAYAAFGILAGLIALALLGVNAQKMHEFGNWRGAPLLAVIPSILMPLLWAGFWNETLAFSAIITAAIALVGTGVLLWMSAK